MKLRVFQDTLVAGQWTGTGVGDFSPDIAKHLIKIGVAELYEAKVVEPAVKKSDPLTSASLPAPASLKKTATKRGRKPTK